MAILAYKVIFISSSPPAHIQSDFWSGLRCVYNTVVEGGY